MTQKQEFERGELLKKPENRLTPEEKEYLYGRGNGDVMMYRRVKVDGRDQVAQRLFRPGEEIPEGWLDSPAKCGARPTAPSREQRGEAEYDAVATEIELDPVPPQESAAESAPEQTARKSRAA